MRAERERADREAPPPPEGFEIQSGRGPFTQHNGPYYQRPTEAGLEQAFFVLPRHCNSVGLIHGGMVATFLDGLLAGAAARASRTVPVTVQLSVNFLDMGRTGDWVVGVATVTRLTRDLAFVEGRAVVGVRDLARASGVFKLMRARS